MAYNPTTGGVGPGKNPGKKQQQGAKSRYGTLYDVPWGSYDPSIEAQLQASRRGLADLRQDTRIANRWSRKDFRQRMADSRQGWQRTRFDLGQQRQRGLQRFRFQRQDLQRDAGRAREDFATRLQGISRQFGQQAVSQQQAQNAAGTLSGGTGAAAAAKRAENQRFAEQPIHTAASRMEQDLSTKLGRVQVGENQLRQDFATRLNRGRQDVRRDRKLSRQDYRRDRFTRNKIKLSRGIREQKAGESDLLAQKIDSARQRNPGAFGKFGRQKKGKKWR